MSTNKSSQATAVRVVNLLLQFQLRRRCLADPYSENGLSLSEAITLSALFDGVPRPLGYLNDVLQLDKSSVSRITSKLGRSGHIRINTSPADRRSRLIQITAKGKTVRERIDRSLNEVLEICTAKLSESDKLFLSRGLLKLADSLGTPALPSRRLSNPITNAFARISRNIASVDGKDFLRSGMSMPQWQILRLLAQEARPLFVKNVRALIPLDQSTVSRALRCVVNMGYVRMSRTAEDRRALCISLSAAGARTYLHYTNSAGRSLVPGLEKWKAPELEKFVEILSRVSVDSSEKPADFLREGYEVRVLVKESERRLGRYFLVKQLSRQPRSFGFPEHLLAADSLNCGLYSGGRLCGVCELRRERGVLKPVNCQIDLRKSFSRPARAALEEGFLKSACARAEF